jgi:hypothetical protein
MSRYQVDKLLRDLRRYAQALRVRGSCSRLREPMSS